MQSWAQQGDRNQAYLDVYFPQPGHGGRTKTDVSSRSWALTQKPAIMQRLKYLQQLKAKAMVEEAVISQREVITRMLDAQELHKKSGNHAHELKALDMLGKATGVYKAPEKNEKPDARSDEEVIAEMERLGFNLDGSTPNRTENGPGRGTEVPQAADVPTVPEAEGVPRTRLN